MSAIASKVEIVSCAEIEVCADFSQASSPIRWRCGGWCDEDDVRRQWQPTPFQIADCGHDRNQALSLVNEWIEEQS